MDQNNRDKTSAEDKVLAFDTLFTTNRIKLFKILLSYLDPAMQMTLSVWIKYLELSYTLQYFRSHRYAFCTDSGFDPSSHLEQIFAEVKPYCSSDEQNRLNRFWQMKQALDSARQMQQMMEMMQELFPDQSFPGMTSPNGSPIGDSPMGTVSGFPSFSFDPAQLSSLMGGENSQMFDLLSAMMNPPPA